MAHRSEVRHCYMYVWRVAKDRYIPRVANRTRPHRVKPRVPHPPPQTSAVVALPSAALPRPPPSPPLVCGAAAVSGLQPPPTLGFGATAVSGLQPVSLDLPLTKVSLCVKGVCSNFLCESQFPLLQFVLFFNGIQKGYLCNVIVPHDCLELVQ